ncbi:hypothetical protein CHUAL_008206 [Chamberlinius hualienensis]
MDEDSLSDCLVIDEDRDFENTEYKIDFQRRKLKKYVIDSDEDNDEYQTTSNNHLKNSLESQNSDKENDVVSPFKGEGNSSNVRRKIRVFSDSESDDDTTKILDATANQKSPSKFDVLKLKPTRVNTENIKDTENADIKKKFQANSDLFDAENSSSDEERKSHENSDEDEELGLNEIKNRARKKYKKSEGKRQSSGAGRRKMKKADIQQLHSDSQKLLRSGRINLPYHVPPKKSLQDFLNRRKCTPEVLKPKEAELVKTLELIQALKQQDSHTKVSSISTLNEQPSAKIHSDVISDNDESIKFECKNILDDIVDKVDKDFERVEDILISTQPLETLDTQPVARSKIHLSKVKRALLEKRFLGEIPRLGGGNVGGVIHLDDELDQFINRFVDHRTVTQASVTPSRTVKLNILKEEQDSLGEKVFRNEKLTVNLSGDAKNDLTKSTSNPGACRQQLMKNLREQIAQKRAQLREKVSQELRIDNEELESELSENEMSDVDHHLHNIDTESDEEIQEDNLFDKPAAANEIEEDDIELVGSLIPAQQKRNYSRIMPTIEFETSQNCVDNSSYSQFHLDSQLLPNSLKLDNGSFQNETSSTQENLDELLNLCTGQFSVPVPKTSSTCNVNDLCLTPTASMENMSELEDLCSGKFNKENLVSYTIRESSDEKAKADSFVDHFDDDNISISSLTSDVDVGRRKTVKRVVSDSEEESDDDNRSQVIDSDVEEEGIKSKSVRGISKFVEDEAELSGSEADSDEDDDGTAKDDVMMEEMGDLDHFSDDELKSQVEKVHM